MKLHPLQIHKGREEREAAMVPSWQQAFRLGTHTELAVFNDLRGMLVHTTEACPMESLVDLYLEG